MIITFFDCIAGIAGMITSYKRKTLSVLWPVTTNLKSKFDVVFHAKHTQLERLQLFLNCFVFCKHDKIIIWKMRNNWILKYFVCHICKLLKEFVTFPKAVFFVQDFKIFNIQEQENHCTDVGRFIVHNLQCLATEIMHVCNSRYFIAYWKLKQNTLCMFKLFILLCFLKFLMIRIYCTHQNRNENYRKIYFCSVGCRQKFITDKKEKSVRSSK